jgi:RNA polymerase sigma-70 factor, ECF subfamily
MGLSAENPPSSPPSPPEGGGDARPETVRPQIPDPRSDETLITDHIAGDPHAFTALVERHHRDLYRFLFRFLGAADLAEDMVQETFLQVHQSAASFDSDRAFRPWLYVIASNKARDRIRLKSRQPAAPLQAMLNPGKEESGEYIDLLLSPAPDPGASAESHEQAAQVRDVVAGMPPLLRQVLFLAYFEQQSYQQIALGLDLPVGTVKSRLHAAVAHFASQWQRRTRNNG